MDAGAPHHKTQRRAGPRWVAGLASLGVHAALAGSLATRAAIPMHSDPIVTTLLELPPEPLTLPEPPPKEEPTPPPPKPAPVPPQPLAAPKRAKPLKSRAQPDALPESPDVAPVAPMRLATVRLSSLGAGVGMAYGNGDGNTSGPVSSGETAAAPAPVPAAPAFIPLQDLSRKPKPPHLDALLSQHYPALLRRRGQEGEALVRVRLSAAGIARQVQLVSESHAGFGAACQKVLKGSRWTAPLDASGKPVATELSYRCRFRVER